MESDGGRFTSSIPSLPLYRIAIEAEIAHPISAVTVTVIMIVTTTRKVTMTRSVTVTVTKR